MKGERLDEPGGRIASKKGPSYGPKPEDFAWSLTPAKKSLAAE